MNHGNNAHHSLAPGRSRPRVAFAALAALGLGASAAHAVNPNDYDMFWYTIDAGGGTSTLGNYAVEGTIGQFEAQAPARSGSYEVTGGFWVPGGIRHCVADVDDGSNTGTPDDGVGIEDLLYYLFLYNGGLIAADVDDGSFTGTPDGGIGIEDLLYFLARYNAGC